MTVWQIALIVVGSFVGGLLPYFCMYELPSLLDEFSGWLYWRSLPAEKREYLDTYMSRKLAAIVWGKETA